MATIITVYDNHGEVGRCDARCHEARSFDCNCVCGGAFHGVGTKIAVEDRLLLTDREILCDSAALLNARVLRKPEQLELFK